MTIEVDFKIGERVVYPAHGVGEIKDIENQTIGGHNMQFYVIDFPGDKMTLKVPVNRAPEVGLRALMNKNYIQKIYTALQGDPKAGNKMWSRRAQEYENKINSGDVVAIAEVVRDLYKNVDTERSYSERTIYESAVSRLSCELAILEDISQEDATEKLVDLLKEKVKNSK